jgi:hypothetical protein
LGLSFSSMLRNALFWDSSPPPPPILSKQVHSSSSSKSIKCDLKVVLYFFLSGEVIGLRLNLSLGVSDSICIFSQWDWCTSKGKVVVEHACFLSFNNCPLVTSLGETCCSWTTYHFWLVRDTSFFWGCYYRRRHLI